MDVAASATQHHLSTDFAAPAESPARGRPETLLTLRFTYSNDPAPEHHLCSLLRRYKLLTNITSVAQHNLPTHHAA